MRSVAVTRKPSLDTQTLLIKRIIRFKDLPYDPFRHSLYTVKELTKGYDPKTPGSSVDEVITAHFNHDKKMPSVHEALAQRIHDHAIDSALYRFAKPRNKERRKIVGVMGGHNKTRADKVYRLVANLTWQLGREGYSIVSGGGPGIMEAANLGSYLSSYKDSTVVNQAVDILEKKPDYHKDLQGYVQAALDVRKEFPDDSGESLAIPTWAYSDEPTGRFSSKIGKYFSNSIREDGLLAIAADGVIFAPGSAGTLQEIFQDATHNSYWSFNTRSPMVFLDPKFYEDPPSIYAVLKAQAARPDNLHGPYDKMLGVFATAEEIVDFIKKHPIEYPPVAAVKLRTFGLSNLRLT
jgi:predicted Rossmann-fold nucleotide-binding protein